MKRFVFPILFAMVAAMATAGVVKAQDVDVSDISNPAHRYHLMNLDSNIN